MKDALINYGLSDREAEVYLACLKCREATAKKISELTGLVRTTIYDIIKSLRKKGVVTSFKKDKKYYFRATKPEALIDLLKDKERIIKDVLPELNSVSASLENNSDIELFEGSISVKVFARNPIALAVG